MNKKQILLAAATATVLAACSSDSEPSKAQDSSTGPAISLYAVGTDIATRSTDRNIQSTDFDAGETVDIFMEDAATTGTELSTLTAYTKPLPTTVTLGSDNVTRNLIFGATQYWPGYGHSLSIWGIYPNSSVTNITNISSNQTFYVKTDQTKPEAYKASDLMIGIPYKASTYYNSALDPEGTVGEEKWSEAAIPMKFKHMLTKINIRLSKSVTTQDITWQQLRNAKVTVHGQVSTTFNPKDNSNTSIATADYNADVTTAITLYDPAQVSDTPNTLLWGSTTAEHQANSAVAEGDIAGLGLDADVYLSYSGVIVPQTTSTTAHFITIQVGSNIFKYTTDSAISLASQKVYTFDIKIHKASVVVTATIEDWDDSEDHIDPGTGVWQ